MGEFEVVVAAGTLLSAADGVVHLPHAWTPGGVSVQAVFTGAHLLHLAAAGCVLNDVFRESGRAGVPVRGVRVVASGGFDPDTWASTGIAYAVTVDTPASDGELAALLAAVDEVAEIPRSLRAGTTVERVATPARLA